MAYILNVYVKKCKESIQMKEVLTGALRYLLGNKKFVLLNMASLTSGLLTVIFAYLIFTFDNHIFFTMGAKLAVATLLSFFGLSVMLVYSLTNSGLYFSRIKEFSIRIMLGSGGKGVFYQLALESLIQIFTSIVFALAFADLILNSINGYQNIHNLIFQGDVILTYILLFWLFFGICITLFQRKVINLLKSINLVQEIRLNNYKVYSKIFLSLQLIFLNLIILILGTSVYKLLNIFILLFCTVVVAVTIIVVVLYQTEWNKDELSVRRKNGADFKDIAADLNRELSIILIFSCFFSIMFIVIIKTIDFSINVGVIINIIQILVYNLFLVFLGKNICLKVLKKLKF